MKVYIVYQVQRDWTDVRKAFANAEVAKRKMYLDAEAYASVYEELGYDARIEYYDNAVYVSVGSESRWYHMVELEVDFGN